jgi:hypothetical protein
MRFAHSVGNRWRSDVQVTRWRSDDRLAADAWPGCRRHDREVHARTPDRGAIPARAAVVADPTTSTVDRDVGEATAAYRAR